MGELNDEIERLSRIDYYPPEKRIRLALKMISTLRTRLESVEAARRDAQESRFALITENEELGADLADASARPESAEQERAKLQAFKSWVHAYLDAHGVPHHPPGAHGAEGCRIGDRLDWLLAQRDRLESAERIIGNALMALQDPNAEFLPRGTFSREAIEILKGALP